MPENNIQEYLFQRIREKLPENVSLPDVIAEKLFISTDSAYRRIRGETPLVLDEATVLCQAFDISVDEILGSKPNSVSFTLEEVDTGPDSFKNFLLGILSKFKQLAACKEKQVIYLSKEIVLFHFFAYRDLFAFKYFFWMRTLLKHPDFQTKFSFDCLPKEIEQIGSEILRLYNTIPSVEILNTECVNSTIAQLIYFQNAGAFQSSDDAKRLYRLLYQLIEHLRRQAESGAKFLPVEQPSGKKQNFQFFHNTVGLADNTVLSIMDGKKTVYLNYESLNYMVTQDEKFCEKVHAKLQSHMRRSTLISSTSERPRNIFFNILLKKLPGSITTIAKA